MSLSFHSLSSSLVFTLTLSFPPLRLSDGVVSLTTAASVCLGGLLKKCMCVCVYACV